MLKSVNQIEKTIKKTSSSSNQTASYQRFKCAYCKFTENNISNSPHSTNKDNFKKHHANCSHYNNPLTEFQCSLRAEDKPQAPQNQRKEEINRIFENYNKFKTTDTDKLPIFFGDTFRNDEVYLDPQNQANSNTKNQINSNSKNITIISEENAPDNLKPKLKDSIQNNETDKNKTSDSQRKSKLNETQSLPKITEHSDTSFQEDKDKFVEENQRQKEENEELQEQLRIAVDHVCLVNDALLQLNTMISPDSHFEGRLDQEFEEIIDQNNSLLNNLVEFIQKQTHGEYHQTHSRISDRESPDKTNVKNQKTPSEFSELSQQKQESYVSGKEINLKVKDELFKILQNDLLNLKELKEKFFQVLLSLDREIGQQPIKNFDVTQNYDKKIKLMEEEIGFLKAQKKEFDSLKNENEITKANLANLINQSNEKQAQLISSPVNESIVNENAELSKVIQKLSLVIMSKVK